MCVAAFVAVARLPRLTLSSASDKKCAPKPVPNYEIPEIKLKTPRAVVVALCQVSTRPYPKEEDRGGPN